MCVLLLVVHTMRVDPCELMLIPFGICQVIKWMEALDSLVVWMDELARVGGVGMVE